MPRQTDEAIKKEIAALKEMKPKVRRYSLFGDDNRASIEVQIEVLEQEIAEMDVWAKYADNDTKLESAIDAASWLEGGSEKPSDGWALLVS